MEPLDALERAYEHAEHVVAKTTPSDYARPTPCPEWDVRALLNHLVGSISLFPAMLRGEQPDLSRNFLGDDPAASLRAQAAANLDAWREPGAIDTPAAVLPGVKLVEVNLCDAAVHSWDLAKATGQDPTLPTDLAEAVFASVRAWPLDVSRSMGAFGPEVVVPEDAPITDRLVALAGREP